MLIKITRSDGGVTVMELAAGFRLVAAVDFAGKPTAFDPPVALETALRKAVGDGAGLATVTFVESEREYYERAADEAIAKWEAGSGYAAVAHELIDESAVPADRTFRDAWVAATGGVAVDMPKARAIHMDRIRAARDEKMKLLDIETLKGNDVQAEKQVLRDIPQSFDLSRAATPEALKALWPAELTARPG